MVRKADWFGPAGIFSTDNPVADQAQIEAEQGPAEDDFEDEEEFGFLQGVCTKCGFSEEIPYRIGDAILALRELLREEHSSERPECPGKLQFG